MSPKLVDPVRVYVGHVTVWLFERLPGALVRWHLEDDFLHIQVRIDRVAALRITDIRELNLYAGWLDVYAREHALDLVKKFTDPIEPA